MEKRSLLIGYYNYTVVLTYIGMLVSFAGILFATKNTRDGIQKAYRQGCINIKSARFHLDFSLRSNDLISLTQNYGNAYSYFNVAAQERSSLIVS